MNLRTLPVPEASTLPISLGIDCSGSWCSVAVLGGSTLPVLTEVSRLQPGEQLTFLFPMVLDLLREVGLAPTQVQRLGVSIGPGSFTGLRLAAATVRTMAHVLGCPVVGVSTLETCAWGLLEWWEESPSSRETSPNHVTVLTDARKGQIFSASWRPERTATGWNLEVLHDAAALSPQEAIDRLQSLHGQGAGLVGGSALTAFPAVMEALCSPVPGGDTPNQQAALGPSGSGFQTPTAWIAPLEAALPQARHVCRATAGCHGIPTLLEYQQVEPVYLRAPDITPPKRARLKTSAKEEAKPT